MDTPAIDTNDAQALIQENYRLNLENNQLLQKMERRYVRNFWFKIVWFILLFVLPLLFLPYFFKTYLNSLGLSAESGVGMPNAADVDAAKEMLDLLRNNQSNPR
jgi:hypothetical protein